MNKFLISLTLLILLIGSVSAISYDIAANVTDSSIIYTFTPDLTEDTEVWFDYTLIEGHGKQSLIMNSLTPDSHHVLVLKGNDTYEYITTKTTNDTPTPFYAQFGLIGLFFIILAMLYLSMKIPYIGYAGIALSAIGFMYAAKTSPDFITAIIFAVLFLASFLTIRD